MRRDNDEAFNTSPLQFLRSVKSFFATIFHSALSASLPLLFRENHRLTLHRRYVLGKITVERFIAVT
jgi:hypothetical protein